MYDLTRILTDWHNITVEKKLSKAGRREGRNQLRKSSREGKNQLDGGHWMEHCWSALVKPGDKKDL